ncbi:MAG TPA: UDP-N-acetylglucosamine 2-epimerase (non-hydrolyzing) [Anaerolineales bacterium]
MAADKLRVLTVLGTRPEAVKLAPVIQRLAGSDQVESTVCVTAQHRQMLDIVLALFDIVPHVDLDLMRPDQSLAELTAAVCQGLDPVFLQVKPDWVLVQGDTTTVMAAGLLAYYHRVRLGHVEAGLRTGDKWQPFPEEINRRLAGVLADLHFAPTETAKRNLLAEGMDPASVHVTGNPVIDALQSIVARPHEFHHAALADLAVDRRLVLLTAHRRESFGPGLEAIFGAVRRLADAFPDQLDVVYPVHLNPQVQEPARRLLAGCDNIHLIEPLDYLDMVHLMKASHLILTDSGGIQEEAPALGVPVLVLRDKTERPEALEAGTAKLVGTDPDRIFETASRLLRDDDEHAAMAQAKNPFGDGRAAERIVDLLLQQPR